MSPLNLLAVITVLKFTEVKPKREDAQLVISLAKNQLFVVVKCEYNLFPLNGCTGYRYR